MFTSLPCCVMCDENEKVKQVLADITKLQMWVAGQGYEYVGATPYAFSEMRVVLQADTPTLVLTSEIIPIDTNATQLKF